MKSTYDLGMGAYILMNKYKVADKNGNEIVFHCDENDHRFDELQLQYLTSEFHRFDCFLMSVKKLGQISIQHTNIKKTITDLGAAAYLLMHGYKMVGRMGKQIYFDVSENEELEFEDLLKQYLSSDFHQFDSYLMSLKKMS